MCLVFQEVQIKFKNSDDLPFCNSYFSIDWTENQITFDNDNSNVSYMWNMFKNRWMHLIHLNVNSPLQKNIGSTPSCAANKCLCSRYWTGKL